MSACTEGARRRARSRRGGHRRAVELGLDELAREGSKEWAQEVRVSARSRGGAALPPRGHRRAAGGEVLRRTEMVTTVERYQEAKKGRTMSRRCAGKAGSSTYRWLGQRRKEVAEIGDFSRRSSKRKWRSYVDCEAPGSISSTRLERRTRPSSWLLRLGAGAAGDGGATGRTWWLRAGVSPPLSALERKRKRKMKERNSS